MGTVLHEQPDPVNVQGGQMCIRPQGVAGLHHGTSAFQRLRDVLADELRVGLLPDGAGHHIRIVVLDILQEGRAVLRAHHVRLQDHQVLPTPLDNGCPKIIPCSTPPCDGNDT